MKEKLQKYSKTFEKNFFFSFEIIQYSLLQIYILLKKTKRIKQMEKIDHIQIRLINGENPEQEPSQIYEIPENTTSQQLYILVNKINNTEQEPYPYSFYCDGTQITDKITNKGSEQIISITYYAQAVFRCRSITRTTHTMTSHSNSILSCKFSQDSPRLASCSGDNTV